LAFLRAGFTAALLPDRFTTEFDPVSIVHQAVQNAVGHRGITDLRMPLSTGNWLVKIVERRL
jgi:hypothetical protein